MTPCNDLIRIEHGGSISWKLFRNKYSFPGYISSEKIAMMNHIAACSMVLEPRPLSKGVSSLEKKGACENYQANKNRLMFVVCFKEWFKWPWTESNRVSGNLDTKINLRVSLGEHF